ncbi:GC-rich sequence DNA-binding factor-like protein-domain-containing protein [Xylaria bambusicola]|uniref:GC-rich sequence DNA-binding factor-like protein-domain-containing protein n=1 Tax=Xylaria bambusicola TaxID=326684 RepID=UPI002008540C|nr:GC-rich sequence DNA-binding factor-like protein-domain-containing protein [Xylaria bambusicola]KAI0515167.1 GC-rich sequence DNA-binding factor-like protein-domain-containing protein [Xylaria bambusicola]
MSFSHAGISKADAAAYSSSEGDESDNDGLARPTVDPRDDEFGDYNPRKRRRTGRNAKESAALGIFGSDSDEDTPNRRWKSKQNLRHKNVAFVSAGAEKLGEQADEEDQDNNDHDELSEDKDEGRMVAGESEDEEEDEDEEMAGVGLGFRSSTQGSAQRLGWGQLAPNMFGDTPSKRSNIMKTTYDGSNPLGKSFVPTSAKEPILNPNVVNHEPSPTSQAPKPSAFGGGGSKSKSKSFAARMMAKMGYVEGQGLGADSQGRASIIEATLRPQGNVGLGTVREKSQQELKEEKRQARLRGEDVLDSDEERKKAKRERKKRAGAGESGSGSGVSTPRRPKTKYMTVGDIKKAAPGLHIPEAFAPILDMTGPDQRLLTSGSGLLTPTAGAAGTSSTEVVEQTEARKLARQVQGTLAACVEEWKALEERKAWLDMEVLQRQQEVEELESEFSLLQAFSLLLGDISQAARDQQWDPVISGLQKVETEALGSGSDHNEELASIAVAAIHPFLTSAIQGWQPLEDPNLGNFVTDLSKVKKLLGIQSDATKRGTISKWTHNEVDDSNYLHVRSTTPYESMIYKLVFPKLVTTISQTWNVQDATPLLTVLEKWEPLFPAFVRSQLLEQVARKLESSISSWRPKNERSTPPHLWIFPWLQHLPSYHLEPKGTGVVSEIRRKFRQTIDSWQFDKGVVPGLRNWQDVLRPSRAQDQWKPLVMHHILPSMGRYIRTNFRVDPGDQEPYLKMLQGVIKWTDVISSSLVGEVVVQEVFPMWHDVLHQWLTSDEVNYEEVGAWFEWWQNDVFPPAIASLDSIKAEFRHGTAMIEKALKLGDSAKHLLPRAETDRAARKSRPSSKPNREQQSKRSEPITVPPPPAPEPATFRDEIEAWCLDNDLQFIPIRKTNELGHHYFRLTARLDGKGGVLAYFSSSSSGSGGREEDVLVVESRKTNGEFRRAEKADWDALLAVLFEDAEGK